MHESITGHSSCKISLLDAAGTSAWNEYVATHPDGSSAHLAEWQTLIGRVFGKRCYYLQAIDGDRIVGILPIVHMKSLLFGNFMVSVPYLNYGGVLADHPTVEKMLLNEAARIAGNVGAKSIEYREKVEKTAGRPCRLDKVAMLLHLPDSEEALAKQLGSKLRSQIKRPQRENPEVFVGQEELVDDFYEVFARNMRDLGTPVYSKRLFAEMLQTFPAAYIVLVRLRGRPVAGAFLLGYRAMLEIPWASTISDVNHLSMNMLLYWEVLRNAIARGYKTFDFGRSTVDAGTYRFKKQWGAQPRQLYWYYDLLDGGVMPNLVTSNPKYELAIKVWRRLPLLVTNGLGPHIVKNLP